MDAEKSCFAQYKSVFSAILQKDKMLQELISECKPGSAAHERFVRLMQHAAEKAEQYDLTQIGIQDSKIKQQDAFIKLLNRVRNACGSDAEAVEHIDLTIGQIRDKNYSEKTIDFFGKEILLLAASADGAFGKIQIQFEGKKSNFTIIKRDGTKLKLVQNGRELRGGQSVVRFFDASIDKGDGAGFVPMAQQYVQKDYNVTNALNGFLEVFFFNLLEQQTDEGQRGWLRIVPCVFAGTELEFGGISFSRPMLFFEAQKCDFFEDIMSVHGSRKNAQPDEWRSAFLKKFREWTLEISHLLRTIAFLREKFGIIHRDLKCDNILVSDSGRLSLCDFGFLAFGHSQARCGTINTVSAKKYFGIDYDYSADVYSVGVIICNLLGVQFIDSRLLVVEPVKFAKVFFLRKKHIARIATTFFTKIDKDSIIIPFIQTVSELTCEGALPSSMFALASKIAKLSESA